MADGSRQPRRKRAPGDRTGRDSLEECDQGHATSYAAPLMADDRQLQVLVVQDNEVNQAVAVAILTRLGYRAEVVGDGREAVELVVEGTFGLVLMDCQLPGLDGYQATAEIRRREGTARRTPIVAMTAAVVQDRQACLAAGMDDHIAKPVLLAEVQLVLARWLQHGGRQSIGRPSVRLGESPEEVLDQRRLADTGGWTRAGAARRWSAASSSASWPGSLSIWPTSAPPSATGMWPGPFG